MARTRRHSTELRRSRKRGSSYQAVCIGCGWVSPESRSLNAARNAAEDHKLGAVTDQLLARTHAAMTR